MSLDTISIPSVGNRRTRTASPWSREEIGRLRELAGNGTPLRLISSILRRTESAVRNKAGMHGISLQASGSKANAHVPRPISAAGSETGLIKRVAGR